MTWSAKQYVKFEDERNRPIRDLLVNIPDLEVRTAADIGCGPGNSTELLLERFPGASVLGMDSSADMIEAARKRLPEVRFELADIDGWAEPGAFDLILANAALQWVPGHETLLPALIGKLAPGGALAVQVPDNLDEPAHRIMRELAAEAPWASTLADASKARAARRGAEWYYRLLRPLAAKVDVWRTTYHHPLADGAHGVVEWLKGTGLRPFLDPLTPDEREQYLARYQAAVAEAYPALPDGAVLLPFPRLFFVAIR